MFNSKTFTGQVVITGLKQNCENHLNELIKVRTEQHEKIIEEKKKDEKKISNEAKCSKNDKRESNNQHEDNIDLLKVKEYKYQVDLYKSKFEELKNNYDSLLIEKNELVEKVKECNSLNEKYKNAYSMIHISKYNFF